MASIKLHVFRTEMGDRGFESVDYRGSGELGAGENDQHRTVFERDPASDEAIDKILAIGPELNRLFDELDGGTNELAGDIADVLRLEGSGPVGLRIGVWDK